MNAVMAPSEIARVIAVVSCDIGKATQMAAAFPRFWNEIATEADYYSLRPEWFALSAPSVSAFDVVDLLTFGESLDDDFGSLGTQ